MLYDMTRKDELLILVCLAKLGCNYCYFEEAAISAGSVDI